MERRAKVFIAGSRRLSRLSGEVLRQIDNVLNEGCTVLIGDANGVDKAVQSYLSAKQYPEVVVFCVEGKWRNNVGNWPVKSIEAADVSQEDSDYFSAKDRVMARECEYGFLIWDGRSPGTLTNMIDLMKEAKPIIVYVTRQKRFYTLWTSEDLGKMLETVAPQALRGVEEELNVFAMA